jgi:hypothetical protein
MADSPTSTAVPSLQVGFNYPWAFNDYGQNFGPMFSLPAEGIPRWKSTLPTNLDDLKALGINIVRFFILQNGLNYGKLVVDGRGVIQNIELPIDRSPASTSPPDRATINFWEFNPPDKLHPLFTDHFRQMLEIFRDKGLQVIPSLVDFPFMAVPPDRKRNAGGGRQDIALNKDKRKLFFDTVLEPLLQVSIPFKDQILAWEVMNEPSWLIRLGKPFGPVANDFRMNRAVLRTFLEEALARIESHPEFASKSTVGHRFFADLNTLPTGKLPQFHYYAKTVVADDPNPIPEHKATPNAFVGEFHAEFSPGFAKIASLARVFDPGAPWPELNGRDSTNTVFERLNALAKKGYKLALVWPDLGDDGKNSVKLSPQAQASLKKFTQGK